jgi:hypothetical protein
MYFEGINALPNALAILEYNQASLKTGVKRTSQIKALLKMKENEDQVRSV